MIHAETVWQNIILEVEGKEYRIKHSYLELLALCGIKWMFELRTKCPIWNIKGIGRLQIDFLSFEQEIKTFRIKCKIIL